MEYSIRAWGNFSSFGFSSVGTCVLAKTESAKICGWQYETQRACVWKVAVLCARIFRRKIRRNKTSNDLYLSQKPAIFYIRCWQIVIFYSVSFSKFSSFAQQYPNSDSQFNLNPFFVISPLYFS